MNWLYFNTDIVVFRTIDPNKLRLAQHKRFNHIRDKVDLIWIFFGKY